MRSNLQDDRFIDLMALDNSLTVRTCQYTYTFELTPVGDSISSGAQPGNSNFNGIQLLPYKQKLKSNIIHTRQLFLPCSEMWI